jgi:hypothetical protein
MKTNKFTLIGSMLLMCLFLYAGVSKLTQYPTFKVQLGQSPFITGWAALVAPLLIASEFIIVALLFVQKSRHIGLCCSLFLMTLFTAYIYAMLHDSYYVPCSCGGILSKMGWNEHLIFNIVFVGISITAIILEPATGKAKKTDTLEII